MKLAKEVISVFYGEKLATLAEDKFIKAFQKKEIPDEVEEFSVSDGELLVDALLKNKVISSKGDFRRLVEGGAITNLDLDKKVSDNNEKAEKGVYRVGKKRFVKIVVAK